MDETDLCQRISEKCQRQHWYGPDMGAPSRLQRELDENATYYWIDRHGQEYCYTDSLQIPTAWAFEYAPLTEEQLQSAERLLGFALPPLLHAIYTRVADGGFGPGYGLYHLFHRGIRVSIRSSESMVDTYFSDRRRAAQLVDFHLLEKRTADKKLTLMPEDVWPDGFLCLCDWGCTSFSYLDLATGRVFRQDYYVGERNGFEAEAPTLEAWFERWLAEEMDLSSKPRHKIAIFRLQE